VAQRKRNPRTAATLGPKTSKAIPKLLLNFSTIVSQRRFRRNAWARGVHLGPDMVRDKANDSFAVSWRQPLTRVRKSIRQTVDSDAAIRIEHDFDDAKISKPCRDRQPQRCAQHAGAA
jgi:hypothetical protein